MLARLTPAQAKREAYNLSRIVPRLAQAYARIKQLYILHFPNGPRPYMAEGYRPDEVQAWYYAQGRTRPGPIITWKKPGTSKHNCTPAKAFDVWFVSDDGEVDWTDRPYRDFAGLMAEEYPDIIWGGNFKTLKDLPHYEVA